MQKHYLVVTLTILTHFLTTFVVQAQTVDMTGPTGSGAYGKNITILSNGNYVIADPNYDEAGKIDMGAVYLYNGATHALISTLKGVNSYDYVGNNGITALNNGHYVVKSPYWNNNRGAVTWCNGTTGLNGVVSNANSLVGTAVSDQVGFAVTALTNGNYVVLSPNWDNAAIVNAGAATWCSGTATSAGQLSSSNSLVGTTANDQIGGAVIALSNGNYVTNSSKWNGNKGAVTWGSGTSGVSGAVSSSNSLVGNVSGDQVGIAVISLSNANYVVSSKQWSGGKGAATWCSGATGRVGIVDNTNSLVGTLANDQVGATVMPLSNGNYVIASAYWGGNKGAATWGNGTTGIVGTVSATNSVVGSTANYYVGTNIIALNNGHYVVASQYWNGNRGAATWCNGSAATAATVSAINSLVGNTANDQVGTPEGIIVLSNGNYVVASPNWDNGASLNVGAVTWGNGATGISGLVSTGNSLVGTLANDKVGQLVTPLNNGSYVVGSPAWNGAKGAATWRNGTSVGAGTVTIGNSLVGSLANDGVGSVITALSNGHYVVGSKNWSDAKGAATWCNGTSATATAVSTGNSLVGTNTNDQVGYFITALSNGHYVVNSPEWNVSKGAATWCNGAAATSASVSSVNSLVGNVTEDRVGSNVVSSSANGVTALNNGNYVVFSAGWANGSVANAGAISLGDGAIGTSGNLTLCNSVLAGVSNGNLNGYFNGNYNFLLVGRFNENIVSRIGFPNAGASKISCGVNVITMTPVPASIGTGAWSGGAGVWAGNNYTPSASEAANGAAFVATWTVTNGSCSISSNTNISIDATVTSLPGANKTTCGTNVVAMTPTTPTVGAGTWSGGTGTWAGNNYTPTVSEGSVNGSITATWTVVNGTCSASNTATIAISAPPTANAGADKTTCTTITTTMSPVSPSIGTGAWSGGTGTWNGNDYTPAVAEVGTVIPLSWTVTNGVCPSVTDIATLTSVAIVPAPTLAASSNHVCAGAQVTLTATPAAGYTASQYVWSKNGTIVNTSTAAIYTITTGAGAGTEDYSVKVTYVGYPCFSPQSATTTIWRNAPIATITPAGPTTFCLNNLTTLNATPAMSTYLWKKANTIVQTGGASYIPNTSGNYTLTITDALGCVNTSPATVITVNPLPAANAGADVGVCAGAFIQIGSPTNAANTYTWSPIAGMSISNVSNPLVSPTLTTTYTVTTTNIATGCINTDAVVVSQLVSPATPSLAATANTVCQGTNVILTPTSAGASSINWYKNGVLQYSKATTFAQTVNLPSASADNYSIKSKGANGCLSSFSNYQNVWIKAAATPTITSTPALVGSTITVCVPGGTSGSAALTANSTTASPVYSWKLGANFIAGANANTYTQVVTTTSNNKVMRVQATYPNGCVKLSAAATVTLVTLGCTPKLGSDKAEADALISLDENMMIAYPNPTTDILHISLQNIAKNEGKLLLYNHLGQVIISQNIEIIHGIANENMNLQHLPQGIYTLSFQTDNKNVVLKVVKE